MNEKLAEINWPPPYKIIKHRRARHVKMRASNQHGLEITVPYRFNLNEISSIIEEHKKWILNQLAKIQYQSYLSLPEYISFPCIVKRWQIIYVASKMKYKMIERPGNELVLMGDVQQMQLCIQYLNSWIKSQAKRILPVVFQQVSESIPLNYTEIKIREQKSRWGSCSASGKIHLNYKLIFLPTELIKHVIIHELCHTKQLNHSDKFWHLVAKYDLNWKENKSALRNANQYIPNWIS